MPNLSWHERLETAARRRLPREYAERLIEEWSDHAEELAMVGADPERLGDPEAMVQSVVDSLRRDSYAGRHPMWGFLVRPLLALFLGSMLLTIPADECVLRMQSLIPDADALFVLVAGFVLPIWLTVQLRKTYLESGRAWPWYAASLVLVGAFAAFTVFENRTDNSQYPVDIVVEFESVRGAGNLARFLAPLAMAFLLSRLANRAGPLRRPPPALSV